MLDDLRKMHDLDTEGLLDFVSRQGLQPQFEFELHGDLKPNGIRNIVVSAMGGSALPALFAQSAATLSVPLEIVRGYELPAYVGPDTLVIAASSSGGTEETVEAVEQASRLGARVAVITGGGKLRELAEAHGYLLASLPASFPRLSFWHGYRALMQVLERAEVVSHEFRQQLMELTEFIDMAQLSWLPEVSTKNNPAKRLAQELMGRSIVIYSGPKLYPAAYKWKIGFNENAKQVAWVNQYPELNHNEFTGWSKQPEEKPYAVIELRSSLEHPRIQKRFEVTERLLSGLRPAPNVVMPEGETVLQQLAWSSLFGEYVSLYLAMLGGINPGPLVLVDKFKSHLTS